MDEMAEQAPRGRYVRLMLRLAGGSLVNSSKIDTLRVADSSSGQDIVSLATSMGRSNARTDEQPEHFLKLQKISSSIWRDSNPSAYTTTLYLARSFTSRLTSPRLFVISGSSVKCASPR